MVITDHFKRYALAIPTKNQLDATAAEAFFNRFVVHYGIPATNHSDQDANYLSKIIKELCSITGMNKSRMTSYDALGNGMCERFNRTLLGMPGSLQSNQKVDWKAYVNPLVHAYNFTRHEITVQNPNLLKFGRNSRLPMDMTFGLRKMGRNQQLRMYLTCGVEYEKHMSWRHHQQRKHELNRMRPTIQR